MKKAKTKLVSFFVITILAIVWMGANRRPVDANFLFRTVEVPLSALLVITLLIGMAAGILLSLFLLGKKKF